METLTDVRITYIMFRGEDGEYAAVRGYHEGNEISLTGGLYHVNEGMSIDAVGEWKKHPKYGVQFHVHSYVECRPSDLLGIETYLKSGLISGIGAVSARSIVKHFGTETLNILDTNPDRLKEVDGLGSERISQIKASWGEQKALREVILFLSVFGLSTALIFRIFKKYGEETIQKLQENPYCLADDIDGIGFATADEIALAMGLDRRSYQRCRSGTLSYLSTITRQGHCYAIYSNVIMGVCKLLSLPADLIERALFHMNKDGDIVIEDGYRIYPKMYYDYEVEVAEHIKRIMATPRTEELTSIDDYSKEIKYTHEQKEVIKASLKEKLMIITGEPGSGKTTVVSGIVDTYYINKKAVLLASPTGRAAKVLSDATENEAMTIHRLLEYNPSLGFGYNADNNICGDVLIIDEFSMVDIVLMRHLFSAIPDEMTVILVGDANQIPSVGPGNVLTDMISSGVIPVYHLNQVFRQDEGSTIKLAAHNINKGIIPDLSNPKGADFFFLRNLDEAKIAELIVTLRAEKLPKSRNVDAINDIHVVAPMYKGEAGVNKLNQMLQKALNTSADFIKSGATIFGVGDKVMQTRNDYDKDIYNGSVGIIHSVDIENKTLDVNYGYHRPVEYSSIELGDLDLGYATTVHKAQGSEYPIVIIPLVHSHASMWYRKLLYTAVTRAKGMVILIGSENVLQAAIANVKAAERNTRLSERLRGGVE